jgi:hypothetical protein
MTENRNSRDIEKSKKILAYVQPEEGVETNYSKILSLCAERGGISTKQAERLTDLSYKVCYGVLKELSGGSNRFSPAWREVQVSLSGKMGRPQVFYLLTEPGALAVSHLLGGKQVLAPNLHSAVEITHAFIEMEIYSLAQEKRFPYCAVEEVIPFNNGNSNIRADIVLEVGPHFQIIEIEQEADRASIPRIIAKLIRLMHFAQSSESSAYSNEIWLVFNIVPSDTRTINVWREALQAAREKFKSGTAPVFRWILLGDFHDFHSSLFQTLKALEGKPADYESPEKNNDLSVEAITASMNMYGAKESEMKNVLSALAFTSRPYFEAYARQDDIRKHVEDFLELMRYIFLASNHQASNSTMYGTPPYESIFLLKRYLYAHQNHKLLNELKEFMRWVRSKQTGVTNYRHSMTSLIWDVFLRYHGFSRGPAMNVSFMAPSYDDSRSDYWVDVVFLSNELKAMTHKSIYHQYKTEEAVALAWVLEALYTYTEELGLGRRLWKAKPRSQRRKS